MQLFFLICLFIFGALFGSFASVIIYRIKSGEGGMIVGRSHCKTCERNLSVTELIPIFSWIFQKGKCRGCKQNISAVYPILEVSMGLLFLASGYFLVSPELILSGSVFEIMRIIFFCTIMFFTVIYVFYDILYLEIPESILLIINSLLFGVLILQGAGYTIISHLPTGGGDIATIALCLICLGGLYAIMLGGLKEIYDCGILALMIIGIYFYMGYYDIGYNYSALLSGTIAAIGVFLSFFVQILASKGRAMGGGDLRIAITMGLLLGVSYAFSGWILCYLIGSIVGIIIILKSKIKNGLTSSFNHQVPFGPFIASGYLSVLFFYPEISKFIEWYF